MSNTETQNKQPALHRIGFVIFQWIASLQLAIVLMVLLGCVLAEATFLEKSKGMDYVQWYVYHSSWFIALLCLLALNIFAATLIRYPWGFSRIGFLLTHVGILMILAGALRTFLYGIEGVIVFTEGETVRQYIMPKEDKIVAARQNRSGDHGNMASVWTFVPGPIGWTENETLDLKSENGIWLKILRYYPYAQLEKKWLPDESKAGNAAMEFAVLSSDGRIMDRDWLSADINDAVRKLGPSDLFLFQTDGNYFAEDFNNPPEMQSDSHGVLSMYYNGQKRQVPVKENIGEKITLGDDGLSVEIAEYLPNAKPKEGGKTISDGDQPENPMLNINIYATGKDEPQRQIAFSRFPTFNLDVMHKTTCPVKFWYHHPSVPSSIEFLNTSDGKLYCRIGSKGKYKSQGEIKVGGQVDIMGHFQLKVLQYIPSALQQVTFIPVDASESEAAAQQQAAALVAVDVDGATEQVWLHKDDQEYSTREVAVPDGAVALHFGEKEVPLEFSLKLIRCIHGLNPGRMGDASFGSVVHLIDRAANVDIEAEISMNKPLVYGKYAFYQSNLYAQPDGKNVSQLSVGCDPGRFLKYAGSFLLCAGVFIVFYLKIPRFKNNLAAACAIVIFAAASGASAGETTAFDWDAWRNMPVLDNGRHKPFDTLAKETARTICNSGSVADPESGEKLDYIAFYLTTLFQWEGESKVPAHHMSGSQGYFSIHKADKWDNAPLLPVNNASLREALGLPAGEKYISPVKLYEANYLDPHTGKEIPFIMQVQNLQSHQVQRMPSIDKKTLELADALWVYEQSRMGEMLFIVPMPGTAGDEWISARRLLGDKFDDSNDPKGQIRKAQEQFIKAKQAFLANNAADFKSATEALLAVAHEIGEPTGSYPTQHIIGVEVAYNRIAPFRFAWIFCASAFVLSLLGIITDKRLIYIAAMTVFTAALAAVLVGFTMRTIVSGRAPVTNMFESVVYLGLGATIFGLFFELFSRKGFILAAAAAIATIALVLADNCPVVLDPSLKPLTPILRSNYWLTIHVMTITLSYAAFALALGIGNITLGYYLVGVKNRETTASLAKFIYRTLKAGFLLLIIGTILGAFWADDSWGRFWGWDPKEVWALITLLFYAALLHARRIGWVGNFGMAVWSVLCFLVVIMAWYGVNFMLGVGLHSYGASGGGQEYVIGAMIAQMFYVLAAVIADALNPNADQQSLPVSAD
ncbi:MAG: cytochrome c biogenesis protein CcsA [Thermoguttaceae bacterium]